MKLLLPLLALSAIFAAPLSAQAGARRAAPSTRAIAEVSLTLVDTAAQRAAGKPVASAEASAWRRAAPWPCASTKAGGSASKAARWEARNSLIAGSTQAALPGAMRSRTQE